MATPGYGPFFGPTDDELVNVTTVGYYWVLGPDRTIDWSISNGFYGQFWSSNSAAAQYIGEVLNTYSWYANIKFNFAGWFQTPIAAANAGSEINFAWAGNEIFLGRPFDGLAFFPTWTAQFYQGEAGDVFFNTWGDLPYVPTLAVGSAAYSLFIHEIGHALGLKHPKDDGGTGRPTLTGLGYPELDADLLTVMSYNDAFNWNLSLWDPATPMIFDVLAIQYLYGKNTTTNAGDSVLQLVRTNFYQTIWDASGDDYVSADGQPEGWHIALPNIQFSSLIDTKAGAAMPLSEWSSGSLHTLYWLAGDIENAIGSAFADELIGSSGNNILGGGGGSDLIVGGDGFDWAAYRGNLGRFTVTASGQNYIVNDRTGAEGSDIITGMEALYFADKSISLGVKALSVTIAASTLQSIVELYVAFFNRVPDSEGMEYWIGQAATGVSIPAIANSFYGAAVQYSSLTGYSVNMSNGDFVNVIYQNVLGRNSADAEGLAYWSGALANGSETRGTLVKSILDSAHTFKGNATYGWVADLLDNKYAVGKLFSVDMGLSFNTPQESISEGMRIAAAVTPFDTSAAISLIGVSPADIHLS